MRVSRTLLALAALLLVAACGTSSEIVAPESTLNSGTWIRSGNYVEEGPGQIGSGNAVATAPGQGGTGQMGSGNFVASSYGIGQIGSGNAVADSTSTTERGGAGLLGSGN